MRCFGMGVSLGLAFAYLQPRHEAYELLSLNHDTDIVKTDGEDPNRLGQQDWAARHAPRLAHPVVRYALGQHGEGRHPPIDHPVGGV